jgi:methionyl-tRNA formyltransferase
VRILYFANGPRGEVCLAALRRAGHQIAGVVVHRARPGPDAEGPLARRDADLPVYAPRNPNEPDFVAAAAGLRVDLSVMAGYSRILGKDLLSIPPRGTINLHGGRLPDYRGASPMNWQIINGEAAGACTILHADEGIDTGAILAEAPYPIGPDATAGEVMARTLEIFPGLLLEVVSGLAGGQLRGIPQDPAAGRYWSKRYPWDGEIDWERMTDREVHNLVRGLNGPGLPGAFSSLGGERVVIHSTRVLEETICGPPGRIALKLRDGVAVACRNRSVLVRSVKLDSDVQIEAKDFFEIRGHSFARGRVQLVAQ